MAVVLYSALTHKRKMCIRDSYYTDDDNALSKTFTVEVAGSSSDEYRLSPVSYTHLDVYKRQVMMGVMALPAMLKRGYDKRLATGCILAGGVLGPLIPPSISLVLYGTIAKVSIGALFAGGMGAGILCSFPVSYTHLNYYIGLLLMAVVVIIYTAFGGIRGATLAAAIQGAVMTVAAVLIFSFSVAKMGGLEAGMKIVQSIEPELLTARAVGGIATPRYLASFAVLFGLAILGMPHAITPALIYKNSRAMLRAVVIGAIAVTIWTVLMATTGTLARVADPNLVVPDHATATMTMWGLPPVIGGIVLAGVTAAMQSTVAAMLILLSGSLLMDVYAKVIRPDASFEKISSVTAPFTLGLGMVAPVSYTHLKYGWTEATALDCALGTNPFGSALAAENAYRHTASTDDISAYPEPWSDELKVEIARYWQEAGIESTSIVIGTGSMGVLERLNTLLLLSLIHI